MGELCNKTILYGSKPSRVRCATNHEICLKHLIVGALFGSAQNALEHQ